MSNLSLKRPERTLTLLLIATGSTFAFIGTIEGALKLANLSGMPVTIGLNLFPAHPYLQIFGFLAEFVMGVGYSLTPRFKGKRMPALPFGYMAYALITTGNFLVLLSSFQVATVFSEIQATALFTEASIIVAAQLTLLASHHGGGFPEANPFMILSAFSFVLTALTLFLEQSRILAPTNIFSPQLIYLSLLGFVGSEIYAVEVRSVFIRLSNYRKRTATLASVMQGLAIAVTFLSSFFSAQILLTLGSLLFLTAALSLLHSIRILERAHPLMISKEIPPTHNKIVRYNETSMLLASSWLILGALLGVLWIATGMNTNYVRDSFIHTIAIGFIASTILSFAPLLLPSVLVEKGPTQNLTPGPVILLSLGALMRVAGNLQTPSGATHPVWEALSGVLIIVAMIWFLIIVHRIRR